MKMPKILMIDDDPFFLQNYQKLLAETYTVLVAETSAKGWSILAEHQPAILLLDIGLKTETEGLQILPELRKRYPEMAIIIVTNQDSHSVFNKALDAGADDFFLKSDNIKTLKNILSNLLSSDISPTFDGFIYHSSKMQSVINKARKAAMAMAPVIINGETGSGKEVVARFIHFSGPRKNKPLVAINCGALTDTLLQDTFLGHEKGSFSGAYEAQGGSFEQADGGTIFLDELEDLSPKGQATLLRILQEKEVQRIGGKKTISVDTRVIAALKRPLKELVDAGRFREDLYYRLAVFSITIPPLRERVEDINPLIRYFLKQEAQGPVKLTQGALRVLLSYTWPGNVRELKNVLERARAMGDKNELCPSDFSVLITDTDSGLLPYDMAKQIALYNFKQNYIKSAMVLNNGNISRTARDTGLSRQTIQQFLRDKPNIRPGAEQV